MPEWFATFGLKSLGALAGAVIAAWYRKVRRIWLQIFSAWWIGTVSSHWVMDFFGWPVTADYLLMSGSAMGLLGFTLVEAALSPDTRQYIRSKMSGK